MIDALMPYPAYKDSGLPWLGRIPAHWNTPRTKTQFRLSIEKSGIDHGKELLSIYTHIGVRPRKDLEGKGNKASTTDDYWVVRKGDIIVNKLLAWMGAVGVSHYDGVTSPAYDILRPIQKLEADYYHYAFRTPLYKQQFKIRSRGIMEMRLRLYFDQFGQIPLLCPPPEEQAAIVRFLAHFDRRIRRYIRAKRQLIALLNEQKQAIIHSCVTRGLDPNVQVKPSGVEFMGDVPKHWEVSQLRRLVQRGKKITYGIVQPGQPDPSGRFMVRGQDYSFGWAAPETVFKVSDAIEIPYSRSRLSTGDLVMTIVGAGVGNVAIVPEWLDGANITQTTARISIDHAKAVPGFVSLVLQGPIGRLCVEQYVKGAAQPGLNLEHVRIFPTPLPSIDEQRQIINAVERQVVPLSTTVERANKEVVLLQEYRARLIVDVVTGKLDVRKAAARLPDEVGEGDAVADEMLEGDDVNDDAEIDAEAEEVEA